LTFGMGMVVSLSAGPGGIFRGGRFS